MATNPTAAPATAAAPRTTTPAQPASTTPAPTVELAAWQTLPITDVDGATFTLADLVGKPVLVETFATWCSNCRAQLGDTNTAAAQIGDAAHVVALSVETDLDASTVADYAVDEGFDHVRFAVMSPELLAAMVEAFGNTVANPPTTPKIVVDAAGNAGELTTGFESPDELVAQVAAAG
jgi:thiol-disulfide isomerase/thioredoxin